MNKVPQILGGTTLPAGKSCKQPTKEAGLPCLFLKDTVTLATPSPQPRSLIADGGHTTVPWVTNSETIFCPLTCSTSLPLNKSIVLPKSIFPFWLKSASHTAFPSPGNAVHPSGTFPAPPLQPT